MILLDTSIDESLAPLFENLVSELDSTAKIVFGPSSAVTHVVCATSEPGVVAEASLEFAHGIALGVWVVADAWIWDSVSASAWVDETPHEIQGHARAPECQSPRCSREMPGSLVFNTPIAFYGSSSAFRAPFTLTALVDLVRSARGVCTKDLATAACVVTPTGSLPRVARRAIAQASPRPLVTSVDSFITALISWDTEFFPALE